MNTIERELKYKKINKKNKDKTETSIAQDKLININEENDENNKSKNLKKK